MSSMDFGWDGRFWTRALGAEAGARWRRKAKTWDNDLTNDLDDDDDDNELDLMIWKTMVIVGECFVQSSFLPSTSI